MRRHPRHRNGQIAVDLYRAEHDAEQIRAVAKITPINGAA